MITEPISASEAKELLEESNRAFDEEVRRHAVVKRQLDLYNESIRNHCRHEDRENYRQPIYDEEAEAWVQRVVVKCRGCGKTLETREANAGSAQVVPDNTAGATGGE